MGMALKFNCSNCNGDIYTKFLKIGEEYKCKNCLFVRIVPENAQSINESEIPEVENASDTTVNEIKEVKKVTIYNKKKYPALKTISGFFNFIAIFSIICAVIVFFYGATMGGDNWDYGGLITMIGSIIYGLIAYLLSKAIAEGILLFIDIANDLNDLKTNLLKK